LVIVGFGLLLLNTTIFIKVKNTKVIRIFFLEDVPFHQKKRRRKRKCQIVYSFARSVRISAI